MWNRLIAFVKSHKSCAVLLLLFMPGTFIAVPLWWLCHVIRVGTCTVMRILAARGAAQPPASAARA